MTQGPRPAWSQASQQLELADSSPGEDVDDALIMPVLIYAFGRLHKMAFGVATGVAGATFMALLTIACLTIPAAKPFPLELLKVYFAGFHRSWSGVFIGAGWGFVVGFVAGWFGAFCRNLALAITSLLYRTRAEFAETKNFLDHI